MKRIVILLLGFLLFTLACSPTFQGKCRHNAVYTALVFGEYYPVRIAVGKLKGKPHAQGQTFINGKWVYLFSSGEFVKTREKIPGFIVEYYTTPERYFKKWLLK